MSDINHKEELKKFLLGEDRNADYLDLVEEGEYIDLPGGKYQTVHTERTGSGRWMEFFRVITMTPDQKMYQWEWESGLTEMQENEGPGAYGDVELKEVKAVEEIVTLTKYVEVES